MTNQSETVIQLANRLLQRLSGISPRLKYPIETDLIYEGHIPIVAILIIEGKIKLIKGRKMHQTLTRGSLVGTKELLAGQPFGYTAHIEAGTEICYLDRSALIEILEGNDEELLEIFQQFENAIA